MVQRGEVALTDPVSKYLPPDVKMPERGGKKITLVDLATHTLRTAAACRRTFIRRIPPIRTPTTPWRSCTSSSRTVQLTRDIGSKYEYSNLGVGLLGHALAPPRRHRLRDAGADPDSGAAGDEEHRHHAVARR